MLSQETLPIRGQTCFKPREGVRNILLTGGAGFIASWVASHIATVYGDVYNLVVFDYLDYSGSIKNLRHLQDRKNFHFVYGDIRSFEQIRSCMERFEIDTVLHFAAQSHVGRSFDDPIGFTSTNVIGTQMLLENARQLGVRLFLHFSTDEVYGEVESHDGQECTENSPLRPGNPYSASKAAAEMIVQGYAVSYRLPVLIIRSNNAYGPHQFPEKLIPRLTLRLHRGLSIPLHGDGQNSRRYLYVSDVVDAVDTILHRGTIGEAYNIGSSDEVTNQEVCMRLLEMFGISSSDDKNYRKWIVHTPDRLTNDSTYHTNGEKLEQLGWKQRTSLEAGLKMTVDWFKAEGLTWWGGIEDILQDVSYEHASNLEHISNFKHATNGVNHLANGNSHLQNGTNHLSNGTV